jgi:hypothetical protein
MLCIEQGKIPDEANEGHSKNLNKNGIHLYL